MRIKLLKVFIFLVFMTGLLIFLYPYATRWLYEQDSERVVESFMEKYAGNKEISSSFNDAAKDDAQSNESDKNSQIAELNQLFYKLKMYNKKIYDEKQSGLKDPFSCEGSELNLKEYGFEENIIGVLWIPRMELELPIYMGATHEYLAKGIGLLGNTSIPLGDNNTNTVLAGHRGWKGIPMFRNIQSIQLGDKIQITTPWDTFVYRVTELKIVPKNDSSVLYIQEGREIITLLTCHPYTRNEQRYIVIAERSDEVAETKENDIEEAHKTESSEPQKVQVVTDKGTTITHISPNDIKPVFNEGTFENEGAYSNSQIWLETWVPIIGIVVVLGTIIVTWLIISMKLKRKNKTKNNNGISQ